MAPGREIDLDRQDCAGLAWPGLAGQQGVVRTMTIYLKTLLGVRSNLSHFRSLAIRLFLVLLSGLVSGSSFFLSTALRLKKTKQTNER